MELDQLRQQVHSLEEQSSVAAQHLQDSYTQLAGAQHRLNEQNETMEFLREVFEASQEAYDESLMSRALVQRFCDVFEVDRCSLMRLDDQNLRIAAHRGMDADVAGRVTVPLGEGVAGWVATHRKPVLMRKQGDASPVRPTGVDHYNSDSFVSVPLVHQNRLLGVLNLSNKRDGKPFDETDLDRAIMASAVLSMSLGVREVSQGAGPARGATSSTGGIPVPSAAESLGVVPPAAGPPVSLEQRELPPFELRG